MALYVGTNYHPHDWDEARWKKDIELMKQAGFTTVRLGHLCWDSYEPEDGVYTFDWFDKVMDGFWQAGINVVLDISMRPAPVWVHKLCPGSNIYGKSGQVQPSLRRYMEDIDDPLYQKYAFRFAEKLVNQYKEHPALLAFGLCNEIGDGYVSYSDYATIRFRTWLQEKYVTIEALNKAWATWRWSRRLLSFDDVVLQENEIAVGAPEAWLDMRRFWANGIEKFIIRLGELVEEIAPGIPHSSNHYSGKDTLGFDYTKICDQFVDYPGVGFYPGYGDSEKLNYCNTIYKERLAETGKPMWCLEFQAGRSALYCAPKDITRMYAFLCLLNRGQMFLAWTWRSMLSGEEQFHYGLIGHDGIPTPNYEDFQRIAVDMKKLEPYAFPYLPEPEIAVAFSRESEWVSQYSKHQFEQPYISNLMQIQKIFEERNLEYNMVDLRHVKHNYKLLVVSGHALMDQASSEFIRKFVSDGGIVIMTGNSCVVDESGKVFPTPKPGRLDDVFGIRVAGFYRTDIEGYFSKQPVLKELDGKKYEILEVGRSEDTETIMIDVDYYELLELKTAVRFADFCTKESCAISVNKFGEGKAYYVATEMNEDILSWLIDYLIDEEVLKKGVITPPGIQAREIAENQVFYVNTTNRDIKISLQEKGKGILSEIEYTESMILKAYDGELIVSEI